MTVSKEAMRSTAAKAAALAAILMASATDDHQDDAAKRIALGFIKRRELYRALPYDDGFGNQTIGYGHLIKKTETITGPLTPDEALTLLSNDFEAHRKAVDRVPGAAALKPQQLAALYSFAFNVGPASIETSGIAKAIEEGQLKRVPKIMLQYVKATDRKTKQKLVVKGLVARRAAEIELWNSTETLK